MIFFSAAFFVLISFKDTDSSVISNFLIISKFSLSFLLSVGSITVYFNYSENDNPVNITVVQPNIDPYNVKFTGNAGEQIEQFLSLAEEKTTDKTDYIIGPETALPYSIWISKIKDKSIVGSYCCCSKLRSPQHVCYETRGYECCR